MPLVVTNTLTRKKEPFVPLKPGEVKMYVCGPTVYNFIHIGNARPLVFFDVVSRFLKHQGFHVTRVMNYTDVDDKIIAKAKEENSTSEAVALRYIQEYNTDARLLGVQAPDIAPKVSESISQIIDLVSQLIASGAAYVASNGEVFYSVRSFKDYGKLSGKRIDDLVSGARIEVDEKKKDPLDFSLWKPRKEESEIAWDSPWGKGRPGWHIECSAMAMTYLGETFDIHGGGLDLIHPHHENEIAQTEAVTKKLFARYWLHNNMLTIKSEKMSKSLGNVWLTREFIEKYGAETLKYFLLSGHYRSTIDFSDQQIRENQMALHRIYSALEKCAQVEKVDTADTQSPGPEKKVLLEQPELFRKTWIAAMEDDFNTPKVMAAVFDYVRLLNAYLDKKGFKPSASSAEIAKRFRKEMAELSSVLNLFAEEPTAFLLAQKKQFLALQGITEDWLQSQIEARKKARQEKNFTESDRIRDALASKGIAIKDQGGETNWDPIFGG